MIKKKCYTYLQASNSIGIIVEGIKGYYKTDLTESNHVKTQKDAESLVNELNKRLGLTNREVMAMEFGSMFGWDVPGAQLESWNEDGTPVETNQEV